MVNIFMSYARQDDSFVSLLAKGIESSDHSVFFAGSVSAGERFQEAISTELKRADVVVLVVSENSVASKWVMTEIGIALGYGEERGKPLIIPIVVDDVTLPPQLLRIQSIRRSRDDVEHIVLDTVTAIDRWIGRLRAKEDEKTELQERVEENAATYISDTLDRLQLQEKRYRRASYGWYLFAFVSLLGGVGYGVWRVVSFKGIGTSWITTLQFFVVSLLVVGLIIALSRFSFVLGRSFMVESLRNSDRIHAISFGKFYLKAYGSKADWQEVKEVFQHWNIDKGSDFMNQNPKDFDPEIFRLLSELVAKLGSKAK